jgi:hypothetical protein
MLALASSGGVAYLCLDAYEGAYRPDCCVASSDCHKPHVRPFCRMNILIALLIGAFMGGLNGVGIFFEPSEPYKIEILLAATLKGVLISLLTGFSLGPGDSWLRGAGFGMLYGFAFGLVIFLAKGAFKSKDAPYVVPMSIVTGLITGVLLANFAF